MHNICDVLNLKAWTRPARFGWGCAWRVENEEWNTTQTTKSAQYDLTWKLLWWRPMSYISKHWLRCGSISLPSPFLALNEERARLSNESRTGDRLSALWINVAQGDIWQREREQEKINCMQDWYLKFYFGLNGIDDCIPSSASIMYYY